MALIMRDLNGAALCALLAILTLAAPPEARAQSGAGSSAPTPEEMRQILQRLDQLEAQNRALLAKIDQLSAQLQSSRPSEQTGRPQAAGPSSQSAISPGQAGTPAETAEPDIGEQLAAEQARTAEQQQTKVEASQKFPIRVTGMALFNAYRDSANSGGAAFPTMAAAGGAGGGATFRQTIIGLDYFGPTTFGEGKISGSVRMDFYGGSGDSFDQLFRLRTADIGIDWADRSFRFALDKPLLAMRDPESLAQVGLPALTGAGNLWFWLPQARFEQILHFSKTSGIRADIAAVGTHEPSALSYYAPAGAPQTYSTIPDSTRPGVEGRIEFFSGGDDSRIEIAPAVHHSVSHDAGASLPTDIYSLDWLARPVSAFEFTGAAFSGTNTAALGGLQQGVVVYLHGARAVRSAGGWGQLKWRASQRLWFNLFTGEEQPHSPGLPRDAIRRNLAYGANVFYRLAPNVLASFEAYQYRTSYVPAPTLLTNHYDLALAYRF